MVWWFAAAIVAAYVAAFLIKDGRRSRLLNILISVDQLFYVLVTLGRGLPDETLSSAAWRTEQEGKWFGRIFRPVIDALFWLVERDHCLRSYESELYRRHFRSIRPKESANV